MKINRVEVTTILALSYAWETLEHYLEEISYAPILHWFAGVEFWANRLISDPLMVLAGYFFWKAFDVKWSARLFSLVWLFLNIVIFNDCMSLQHLIPFEVVGWWGDKQTSVFDLWSIEHFVSGITISGFIFNRTRHVA